jgi:hypothetical protein
LQVTMQDASLVSEFVILMLASTAPGKMTQSKDTDSAAAGVTSNPVINASWEMADRDPMRLARAISPSPFSVRR